MKPSGFITMSLLPVFLLLFLAGNVDESEAGALFAKDDERITAKASELSAHMQILASDLLEGRGPGTRGDQLAQLYIKERLAAADLLPAGDDGTYLQKFGLQETRLAKGSSFLEIKQGDEVARYDNGNDIAIFGNPLAREIDMEAGLVFVGYGIEAPHLGLNDYADIDVRGKIAVVLSGPATFLSAADAAHYGSLEQQQLTAEKHGAVGMLRLWTPAREKIVTFDQVVAFSKNRGFTHSVSPDGEVNFSAPKVKIRATLRGKAAEKLLFGHPQKFSEILKDAERGSPRSYALPSRLRFHSKSEHSRGLTTANIAAILPGSDPALKDEFVVATAHYDHLGIGPAIDGDSIYNGALDNAVGVAMLLEMARQVAAMPIRPKRSVLFLAVGAEEKGLLGSEFFAANPTVPMGKIVANINLDGAIPFYDFSDVIAFGAEQSQMGERLSKAAAQMGLSVSPDPFPELSIFTRSDQYSFVKRGVPSLFLYIGFNNMQGENQGRQYWDNTLASTYHKPNDDLSRPIDYEVVAKFTDVFRRVLLVTADDKDRPLWYEISSFGRNFAPDAPKAEGK